MKRFLSTVITLTMLLTALVIPTTAGAASLFVTIGFLPRVTHSSSIIVRGTANEGANVDIFVNGRMEATADRRGIGSVYHEEVNIDPGQNRIRVVVTDGGSQTTQEAGIFRATQEFGDMSRHWARDDVEILATLGLVNGLGNGEFGPNLQINRAQFAKLAVLGLGLTPDANPHLEFADSAEIPSWAHGYIGVAVSKGLISGFEDHTFKAGLPLTRLQMAVILARALRFANVDVTGDSKQFTDAADIPQWAQADVDLVVRQGLMSGFQDGTFLPNKVANRAEASVVIYRLYQLLQKN